MSERQVGRVLLAVNMLSFVAFIGGLVVILLGFPHMAKNTYFSENALLPGSGNLAFSDAHARAALALAASLTSSSPPSSSSSSAQSPAVRILLDAARSAGLDASTHAFTPPGSDQEHTSVVAVLHAARGDGKEVVVLASEYPAGVQVPGAAESAGLLLALMQLFARAPWLSKDIIFILTPSDAPTHTALDAWLLDYHQPPASASTGAARPRMYRGGGIWGAICVSLEPFAIARMAVGIEGGHGQLPNLDLVNSAVKAISRAGLQAVLPAPSPLGPIEEWWDYSGLSAILPRWVLEPCAALHSLMLTQASGRTTGHHGAFKPFRVEAVSLRALSADPSRGKRQPLSAQDVVRAGKAVEALTRILSNILERLHQSFFLYLLTSEKKYLPPEVFLAPAGALLAPLLLRAGALRWAVVQNGARGQNGSKDALVSVPRSQLAALAVAGFAYCAGALLFFLAGSHPSGLALGAAVVVVCAVGGVGGWRAGRAGVLVEWPVAKAQVLVLSCLGLVVTVLLNFSYGAAASAVLVPLLLLSSAPPGILRALSALLLATASALLLLSASGADAAEGALRVVDAVIVRDQAVALLIALPSVLLAAVETGALLALRA